MITWSNYQQAIFDAVANTQDSLLIEAVAGSGKTTTIVEAIKCVPPEKRVAFLAFNKSIADELGRRIASPNASCMTLHSAGFRAWKMYLGFEANLCQVDQNKTWKIMKEVMTWKEKEKWGETTRKMVGFGKQAGIVPDSSALESYRGLLVDREDIWEEMAEHYSVDWEAVNLGMVRRVLAKGIELAGESVDYDDMLYMPVISRARFEQCDVVFIDEAQDLSAIQHEMVARMVSSRGRVIGVGDKFQSCYAFRGAVADSMDRMAERFSMRSLPLSVSYRCPQSIVQHAKQWVPQIEWSEMAAWGYVGEEGTDWKGQAVLSSAPVVGQRCLKCGCEYTERMKEFCLDCPCGCSCEYGNSISKWTALRDFLPTDAILCRLTRPLIEAAFLLIREKVGCRVLGRDIGQGLTELVKKVAGNK